MDYELMMDNGATLTVYLTPAMYEQLLEALRRSIPLLISGTNGLIAVSTHISFIKQAE